MCCLEGMACSVVLLGMAPLRPGGFQEVDTKVMMTVGGALLVIVVLGCVVGAALSPYMTPLSWKVSALLYRGRLPLLLLTSVSANVQALFFAVALVLNIVLCSVQAVVLVNLWEYSKDHMCRPHLPSPTLASAPTSACFNAHPAIVIHTLKRECPCVQELLRCGEVNTAPRLARAGDTGILTELMSERKGRGAEGWSWKRRGCA